MRSNIATNRPPRGAAGHVNPKFAALRPGRRVRPQDVGPLAALRPGRGERHADHTRIARRPVERSGGRVLFADQRTAPGPCKTFNGPRLARAVAPALAFRCGAATPTHHVLRAGTARRCRSRPVCAVLSRNQPMRLRPASLLGQSIKGRPPGRCNCHGVATDCRLALTSREAVRPTGRASGPSTRDVPPAAGLASWTTPSAGRATASASPAHQPSFPIVLTLVMTHCGGLVPL